MLVNLSFAFIYLLVAYYSNNSTKVWLGSRPRKLTSPKAILMITATPKAAAMIATSGPLTERFVILLPS